MFKAELPEHLVKYIPHALACNNHCGTDDWLGDSERLCKCLGMGKEHAKVSRGFRCDFMP